MTHRRGTIHEITNDPGTSANFQQDNPESSQGLLSPREKKQRAFSRATYKALIVSF